MLLILVLLFETFTLAFLKEFGTVEAPNPLVLIFLSIATVAFILDLIRSRRFREIQSELALAYIWRLFMLLFDRFGNMIYTLPNSGSDSEMFYYGAIRYMQSGGWTRGFFVNVTGTLMRVVGTNQLFIQYLLMLCSIVTLYAFAEILRICRVDRAIYKNTILVVGLLPNVAILSSLFLRESIVAMFVTLSLACFMRWLNRYGEYWYWVAFVFVFFAARFHSGTVGVALGYIVVRFIYDKKNQRIHVKARNLIPTILFALIFAFLFLNYSDKLFGKMAGVESIEDIANTNTKGGSSYAQYVGNSNSPISMVIFTIPRIVYFLFSPFPWQWRGIADIIAFVFSSLFYITALRSAYLAIRYSKEDCIKIKCLLVVAACITFIFAWGTANTGTAARHREKAVIIYATIWALSNEALQLHVLKANTGERI